MYFADAFPSDYEVLPKPELMNAPELVRPRDLEAVPEPGKPLNGDKLKLFVNRISEEIAKNLDLKKVDS
jgi:threonine synthase